MLNVAGRYVYLEPGRDPRFCISSISCCVLLPVFLAVFRKQGAQSASFYMRPSSVSYRSPLGMSKAAILYNTGIPSPNAVMIPQGTGGQRGGPFPVPRMMSNPHIKPHRRRRREKKQAPTINPAPSHPPSTSKLQTGNSAFLLPTPNRSTTTPIHGPTTGTPLAKPAIVPRKSPNSTTIPYSSTTNPISGHRSRISASPAKKAAVPLSFCLRAKKRAVFCGPMMMVRPIRKRIWINREERG